MPRGPSATTRELEFVFYFFERGYSNADVRRELEEEEFPLRDPRTIRNYRKMYEDGMAVGHVQNATADRIAAVQAARHNNYLIQAVEFLKNYTGQASQIVNARWMPTDVDQLRIRDLLSHLQNPELEEAIRVSTQDPPHDDKTTAAGAALGILQHILLRGVTSGRCEHCEIPVRPG